MFYCQEVDAADFEHLLFEGLLNLLIMRYIEILIFIIETKL